MRRVLAIMFLLIFTCQVLPVKVWGKLLNNGQNTEEEAGDDAEDAPDGKTFKYGEDQIASHHTFDIEAATVGFNNKLTVFIHKEESLPSVHVAELHSPPPDFFCAC